MAAGVPVCSRWAHRMGAARQQLLRISLTEEPYALKMPDSLSQVPPPLDPAPADSVPWSSVFPDPFWRLRGRGSPPDPVLIDARSPSEFAEDHLPGAINIPVLSDEQRAEVGKMYCSGDVLGARLCGASYVCANISRSLSGSTPSAPSLTSLFGSTGPSGNKVKPPFLLVYCWRGGQRSLSLATILSEVGWPGGVGVLDGGYRSWRRLILRQLEAWPLHDLQSPLWVISGLTGCGKTLLLEELEAAGERIIHLERLANHKGSVFGQSCADARPSQREFERELHGALANYVLPPTDNATHQSQQGTDEAEPKLTPVWTECESRSVGPRCRLPNGFFSRLRSISGLPTRRIWLDVPEEARIEWILTDYAYWLSDLARLDRAVESLSAYHSRSLLESWRSLIRRGDYRGLVASFLRDHYDPHYKQSRGPVLQDYARAGLLFRVPLPRISKDLIRSEILPLLRELTTSEDPHQHHQALLGSCPI
nr:unnamed protein product [Spirometra erinaceieuropaei]